MTTSDLPDFLIGFSSSMAWPLDAGGFEFLVDIDAGHGAECLAALAGGKGELRSDFGNTGGDFLEGEQFLTLAAHAGRLKGFHVAEVGTGGLVGLALGNEEIAGIAGADFDDVGFGTEAFDFFFEDDLCVGHGG